MGAVWNYCWCVFTLVSVWCFVLFLMAKKSTCIFSKIGRMTWMPKSHLLVMLFPEERAKWCSFSVGTMLNTKRHAACSEALVPISKLPRVVLLICMEVSPCKLARKKVVSKKQRFLAACCKRWYKISKCADVVISFQTFSFIRQIYIIKDFMLLLNVTKLDSNTKFLR